MARLLVVSNRVPDPADAIGPRAGGLAVVLADALAPGSLWFGWSGRQLAERSEAVGTVQAGGISYATIDLSESDYRAFYLGFSNGTLWPLFHMLPSFVKFNGADYEGYKYVNKLFATALAKLLDSDDVIWIHDYQLLGVAAELRDLGVNNRTGFFLHIPFPAPALFETLPPAEELFQKILAHDLIGFQTAQDKAHFLATATMYHLDTRDDIIMYASRTVRLIVAPVGINYKNFNQTAIRAVSRVEARRVIESLAGRTLMIGADRLDYTKGLPARFEAYGRFLTTYAGQRRHINYLQIAAPSREEAEKYKSLREELDYKAGTINGAFSDFDWVPLRYMTRTVGRSLLAGLFRIARIGLVTPLRDGMNLVAMEYIAAQPEDDPGILILSRFAGAAALLPEALQVNPYDADAMAEAINKALTMSRAERIKRHTALLARVQKYDCATYSRNFLAALKDTGNMV